MNKVVNFPLSLAIEDEFDPECLLTGTLIIADDYLKSISELLDEKAPLTERQRQLIEAISHKMLGVQLKASALLIMPQDGGSHDR